MRRTSLKRMLFCLLPSLLCPVAMVNATKTPADKVQGHEEVSINQTLSDFERLSAQLNFLDIDAVLYDRDGHLFRVADPQDAVDHREVMRQVKSRRFSQPALLELLRHRDPKIRTLALVALLDREDPNLLLRFVDLAYDTARTFDGHPKLSEEWLRFTGIGPPKREQTVGHIASRMAGLYLAPAGYVYGIDNRSAPDFDSYWRSHEGREYCAGWFLVQLTRASRGRSPTPPERVEKIRAVRNRVDLLPADDRAWTLLWLSSHDAGRLLVSETELTEAALGLGPDKLLRMLQKRIPSDDPDVQSRPGNNWKYHSMMRWVLQRAATLLRPDQAQALLACEQWERDYQLHRITDPLLTAWFAIAAAELQPKNATEWLQAALPRFQESYQSNERADLAAAIWRLQGPAQLPFVTNWFFRERAEPQAYPNGPAHFLGNVWEKPHPQQRQLIATIIRDPRLDKLDIQAIVALMRIVNEWLPQHLVEIGLMWQVHHSAIEAARLIEWKTMLRDSIARWS